jgi:hypothetical protein
MMHISAGGDRLVFALCVVFTVCGLTAFEHWSTKIAWRRSVYTAAAALGTVFALMLAAGGIDLGAGSSSFLGLTFLLCGASGGAILLGMTLQREGWREAELRRMDAHDL